MYLQCTGTMVAGNKAVQGGTGSVCSENDYPTEEQHLDQSLTISHRER